MQVRGVMFHKSLHLDDSQLASPNSECLFCGSNQRKSVCVLQDNPQVFLLECTNCNAASASRMPSNAALAEYYRDYYASNLYSDFEEQITFDSSKRFGNYLAAKFNQYLNKSRIRILDFGGGDGSISYWAAKKLLQRKGDRADILVVDYHQKVISAQDSRIALKQKDTLEGMQSNYDIVIASAIIEHLPQPKDILNRLLNLVDKGGIFYARTPCVVPFIKLFRSFGIKWDFTYPAHVHDLGQGFWESYFNHVVSSSDFEIVGSKPSIVETTFQEHFTRSLVAYVLKAPWYLLGRMYKFVGGWEVFLMKV